MGSGDRLHASPAYGVQGFEFMPEERGGSRGVCRRLAEEIQIFQMDLLQPRPPGYLLRLSGKVGCRDGETAKVALRVESQETVRNFRGEGGAEAARAVNSSRST